jgi:hypothetical protein
MLQRGFSCSNGFEKAKKVLMKKRQYWT